MPIRMNSYLQVIDQMAHAIGERYVDGVGCNDGG